MMRHLPKWRLALTGLVAILALCAGLRPVMASPDVPNPASSLTRPTAVQDEGPLAQLSVLVSAPDHLVLELTVPKIHLEELGAHGQQYLQLSSPGLDAEAPPGQPRLPYMGALIGLPPSGGLAVQVLGVESEVLTLPHPLALEAAPEALSPALERVGPLSGVFPQTAGSPPDADLFLPETLVAVGDTSLIRDLRIVRLMLTPFRYNPVRGELEHVRRLVIEVRFEGTSPGARPASDVWDKLFEQAVANYDVARNWRGVRAPSIEAVPNPLATVPGSIKVEVEVDGLYQIGHDDLQSAGLPVEALDPRYIHLEALGQPVAIQVTGEEDGSFDAQDRILFHGQAAESRYTRTNVYWLTVKDSPGQRMDQRDVTPQNVFSTPAAYSSTARLEENHLYSPTYPEASGEHWYWTDLAFLQTGCPEAAQTYTFSLTQVAVQPHTPTLEISAQAYTYGSHDLAVWLNEQKLGHMVWNGAVRFEKAFDFQSALLAGSGPHTLRLENGACPPLPPPAPPPNGVFFNYFTVRYKAVFEAQDDVLAFGGYPGGQQYQIAGFASEPVLAFDVTQPAAPVRLTGSELEVDGRLVFQDDPAVARRYVVLALDALREPRAIYADTPSSLSAPSNRASYLLIGPGEFVKAAQPLLDLRGAQGHSTLQVNVQDIYDEFNYGLIDPKAIRAFLADAVASWSEPPDYVLLLGDGTADSFGYSGTGPHNLIPAYLADVDPYIGETASDNRFATVAGNDPLPDLLLGRLPVSTVAETKAVVDKLVAYETAQTRGPWFRRVLFVADDADWGGDFAALSDVLYEQSLPAPLDGHRIYLDAEPSESHEYDPTDALALQKARGRVRGSISEGSLLVNFMGHSSHDQWALEILLHRDQTPALNNAGRLPVVLSMTCYTGAFHHPPYAPLDERLVLDARGGAVASWGPTGAGVTEGHYHLSKGFFDAFFAGGPTTLGAATDAGKLQLYAHSVLSEYLIDTYVLLGDPATVVDPDAAIVHGVYLPLIVR